MPRPYSEMECRAWHFLYVCCKFEFIYFSWMILRTISDVFSNLLYDGIKIFFFKHPFINHVIALVFCPIYTYEKLNRITFITDIRTNFKNISIWYKLFHLDNNIFSNSVIFLLSSMHQLLLPFDDLYHFRQCM